jgi:hypothetical protein
MKTKVTWEHLFIVRRFIRIRNAVNHKDIIIITNASDCVDLIKRSCCVVGRWATYALPFDWVRVKNYSRNKPTLLPRRLKKVIKLRLIKRYPFSWLIWKTILFFKENYNGYEWKLFTRSEEKFTIGTSYFPSSR